MFCDTILFFGREVIAPAYGINCTYWISQKIGELDETTYIARDQRVSRLGLGMPPQTY